jgi:hypothetical protein
MPFQLQVLFTNIYILIRVDASNALRIHDMYVMHMNVVTTLGTIKFMCTMLPHGARVTVDI